MEWFYIEFGQLLTAARDGTGLTQGALAERVGLNRTSIVNIEKGRQRVLLHQVLLFAEALGVEPAELWPTRPASADEQEWVKRVLSQSEAS